MSTETCRIVALAGGVGGAKLADGLYYHCGERLTIIGNVADDLELWGLRICPDLDTVMYTLAGVANPATGWGVKDDTFAMLDMLAAYGESPWFKLGDKDTATHILRSHWLRQGMRLTEVTQRLTRALGVEAALLPVTDDDVRTIVHTDEGVLDFQTYFVARRCEPVLQSITFRGIERATLTPEVKSALKEADIVIICPSNPFVSIDPILAVENLRARLWAQAVPIVAVSPIIGGEAVKGPAAKMFRELGEEPSALAVAHHYAGLASHFVLDERDADQRDAIEALGMHVIVTDTLMQTREDRQRLAQQILERMEYV